MEVNKVFTENHCKMCMVEFIPLVYKSDESILLVGIKRFH